MGSALRVITTRAHGPPMDKSSVILARIRSILPTQPAPRVASRATIGAQLVQPAPRVASLATTIAVQIQKLAQPAPRITGFRRARPGEVSITFGE